MCQTRLRIAISGKLLQIYLLVSPRNDFRPLSHASQVTTLKTFGKKRLAVHRKTALEIRKRKKNNCNYKVFCVTRKRKKYTYNVKIYKQKIYNNIINSKLKFLQEL